MTWWQGNNGPQDEGPWGKKTSSGASNQKPDIETILKKGQEHFKKIMPRDPKSSRTLFGAGFILVALWLMSGFYQVKEGQQGAVLRFGQWVKTTEPGINFRLPYPFEQVEIVNVSQINRLDSGMSYKTGGDNDNLMLTGDENIVSLNFTVHWCIKNIHHYLFKILDPDGTVKQAAESAVREVLAQIPIVFALTNGRGDITNRTKVLLQQMLDQYEAGIEIRHFQLKSVDPPAQVVDSFRDVQRARADAESRINEAKAYYNSVVPVARGEAAKISQAAEGYRQAVVDKAKGETARFLSILKIYKMAPEVTRKRLYLDTMESILEKAPKVILDSQSAKGVTPFLPLPQMTKILTKEGASQ